MLSNLTYKKSFIYLFIGAMIFMIIAYNLALKKTFSLKKEHKELKEKILIAKEAPQTIFQLRNSLELINKQIGGNSQLINSIHETILENTSTYIKNHPVIIREYPREQVYNEKGYLLRTNIIVVEGRFIDLLKYLHYLECDNSIGRIVSAGFFLKQDNMSGRSFLYLKIFIQNIINANNEN